MENESVFEYQRKHEPVETTKYVNRLKNSVTYVPLRVTLPCADAWIAFNASLFHEAWEIGKMANAYENMSLGMDDFSRRLYVRTLYAETVLNLEIDNIDFLSSVDKNYDISLLALRNIRHYESIFNGNMKAPKTPAQCKGLYDALIMPSENFDTRSRSDRFHYFRCTPLPYGDRGDPISSSLGYATETDVIKGVDCALSLLSENEWDPFTLSGIVFFLLETILPFYHDNFRFSCSVLSLFLSRDYPFLSVQIPSYLKNNSALLHQSFQETLSDKNQGDLSHFLASFEAVIKDGISHSAYQLSRQIEREKTRLKRISNRNDANARIERVLVCADVYTLCGIDGEEILKEAKVSLPSLNRYIKAKKQSGHLVITPLGKKHLLRIKE